MDVSLRSVMCSISVALNGVPHAVATGEATSAAAKPGERSVSDAASVAAGAYSRQKRIARA
ncbi:hypothetical protein P9209_15525 [Prescottella defluvii]|nr:hypothetical protein P9209_15525 [Prescottella defluvii]